jgi:hypothetical protein
VTHICKFMLSFVLVSFFLFSVTKGTTLRLITLQMITVLPSLQPVLMVQHHHQIVEMVMAIMMVMATSSVPTHHHYRCPLLLDRWEVVVVVIASLQLMHHPANGLLRRVLVLEQRDRCSLISVEDKCRKRCLVHQMMR